MRVGLLKQMRPKMGNKSFNLVANALFSVNYCLHVFGNVWSTDEDQQRRFRSFTKRDCQKLQSLQNKVLRMKLNVNQWSNKPCVELVKESGDMSIHQQIAYFTLLQVFKTTQSKKPDYLAKKLILKKPNGNNIFPQRQLNTIEVNSRLTVGRSGFLFRGAKLWNQLPNNMRSCNNVKHFKTAVKSWIREKIAVKPP